MEKTIKMAPTERIDCFEVELTGFMEEVFGFTPGSYMVTDGSRLADFFPTGLSAKAMDEAKSLEAAYDAWDEWVLAVIERRYGVRPEATTVLLTDLLWMLGQQGLLGKVH